jgi:hypothetical protein
LASTPSVGIALSPHYASSDAILTGISPLLNSWGSAEKPNFSITAHDPLKIDIQHEEGFLYSLEAIKASVSFQHRMQFRHTSGGLPVGELISRAKTFSSLMAEAGARLIDAALLLPQASSRSITRIGIVSTTVAALDDLPPGVNRMIEYLSKPWSGNIQGFNFNVTGIIFEDDKVLERCIHYITRGEDEEQLITLKLDWQRYLKKPAVLERNPLSKVFGQASESALIYFEELAVGNAFDEHVIEKQS